MKSCHPGCDDFLSYAGWLKKKSRLHGFWHQRFVSLEGDQLTIYKDDTRQVVEERLKLYPDTKAEITQTKKFSIFNIGETKANMLFLADSIEDATRWVTAIHAVSLPSPKLSMDDFNIISLIGKGFYGKVRLCQKKDTGDLYAIKSVHKSILIKTGRTCAVIAERNLMMKAKFPFLVSLHFTFQTRSKFYFGLEYVPGGDLKFHKSQVGKIPIFDAKLYAAQIGLAITYLHGIGIVYRDLKPENVLLDGQGYIKLVDFGLSKDINQVKTTRTFCGTPEYISPELILKKNYGYAVDEWALGVLMYEIIFGDPPFVDENENKLYDKIVLEEPKYPADADPNLVDIIKKLLVKDPAKRPKFIDLKSHPFFADIDFKKVYNKEYKPSYVPKLTTRLSLENFDPYITNENPNDSYVSPAIGEIGNISGFNFVDKSFDIDEEEEELLTPSSIEELISALPDIPAEESPLNENSVQV
ncbi:AGC family protein kinase [Trichomonas vaginalis G3]|uniref:AGC family protein kinase n=1 Tax=Trichomonas vaginalis (strain ATCC PRA-98 / G3) TaxID=412133 RepID=A2ELF7_TRIV3|nr:protein kinase C protein [Trichomonas vaginalis G3]EAY06484.1 AGC family protein kinase [Trichomonas vaginalis G3]KAI5538884.1 protein kinase C protein [Trichomonas vaginalis G3]|eukprot:XP_001318707.1 AGC family protein kinase [Trichomonas vaginalis G3]